MRSFAHKRAPDLLRFHAPALFARYLTPLTAPATVRIFQLAANDVVYDQPVSIGP